MQSNTALIINELATMLEAFEVSIAKTRTHMRMLHAAALSDLDALTQEAQALGLYESQKLGDYVDTMPAEEVAKLQAEVDSELPDPVGDGPALPDFLKDDPEPADLSDKILSLACRTDGVSVFEIGEMGIDKEVAKKRLRMLVGNGKLRTEGVKRGCRYFAAGSVE